MASADRSFSETEKVNLLAEIIKQSNVPHTALLRVINEFRIDPQWPDISRPPGRSLRDCQTAFNELRSSFVADPASHLQPPPPSAVSAYPTSSRSDVSTSFGARPSYQPPLSDSSASFGRTIQPRPQGLPHAAFAGAPGSSSPTTLEPPPRKRGRPSNADTEARKQHYAALGQDVPPPKRAPRRVKASRASTGTLGTPTSATRSEEQGMGGSRGSPLQESPSKDVMSTDVSSTKPFQPEHLRLPSMNMNPTGRTYDQSTPRLLQRGDVHDFRSSQSRPTSSPNVNLPHLLPASGPMDPHRGSYQSASTNFMTPSTTRESS